MAYKWSLLLKALGIPVPFFTLFRTYTVAAQRRSLLFVPITSPTLVQSFIHSGGSSRRRLALSTP